MTNKESEKGDRGKQCRKPEGKAPGGEGDKTDAGTQTAGGKVGRSNQGECKK